MRNSSLRDLQKKIQGNKHVPETIIFPKGTQGSLCDHVRFEAIKYKGGTGGTSGGGGPSSSAASGISVADTVITLFMPQDIKATYNASWEGKEFKKGGVKTWFDKAKRSFEKVSAMITSTEGSAEDAIARKRGDVENPNTEFLFSKMDARSFSFNFKFHPRNKKESEQIKDVIKAFKKYQHPTLSGTTVKGLYLEFPHIWVISFHTSQGGQNDFYGKVKDAALTSVDVSYGGSGAYASFENGCPTNISIGLNFQETTLLTREDIEKGM